MVKLAEAEYERAHAHWMYTPWWRLLTRARRKREWRLWLRALIDTVKREAE